MFEIFQDSMAITWYFKHLDIFGTITANPKWPKIKNALLPEQKTVDQPDVVTHVFRLKSQALL